MSPVKMERVRYWDGERRGKADGTGLVVDGPRWYGALRCFRVRMDNGGTDWICETHVERELANGAGVKTTP